MKRSERKGNPRAAAVLEKIAAYQACPIVLLEDMTPAEQAEQYVQILAWLKNANPRTTSYLTRRAHLQISQDLDVEMAEDTWWFRFFEAHFSHLLALAQQQQATQKPPVQE